MRKSTSLCESCQRLPKCQQETSSGPNDLEVTYIDKGEKFDVVIVACEDYITTIDPEE